MVPISMSAQIKGKHQQVLFLKTKVNLLGENVKPPEPIVIPLILNMAEFDHQPLIEEWFCSCTSTDKWQVLDRDKLISNVKTIQNYLSPFDSKGLTVLNLSAGTFAQTLDWLHGYLLERIKQGSNQHPTEVASFSKIRLCIQALAASRPV